jgi:DNA-binding NarL/FixJ family response regulator
MGNLLSYSLLSLCLIGILVLIAHDVSSRRVVREVKETMNRLQEQNQKLFKEITGLKKQVEQSGKRIEETLKVIQTTPVPHTAQRERHNPSEHLLLNDRYKEIFDLKERGLSTEQIAKELQKGFGEVAFILDLAGKGE